MSHVSVEAGKYKSTRCAGKAGDPGEPMLGMKSKAVCWGVFYSGEGPSFCSTQAFN